MVYEVLSDLLPSLGTGERSGSSRNGGHGRTSGRSATCWLTGTSTPGPRPWPGSGTAPGRSGCAATPAPWTRPLVRSSRPTPARASRSGVTHVRCGNRRAEVCPSCSRLYAADTFHLIRAGVTGGKTVPESVAENPLVFATVTAPSFGPVHGRRDGGRRCHPHAAGPAGARTAGPRPASTAHARTTRCWVSRCARSATTTPRTWCGSGGHRTCGAGSPSPCAGWSPRHLAGPGQPAGRGRHGAVRQGRGVPAARRDPLPRPGPPRRAPAPPTGSHPPPPRSTPHRWPTWSARPPPRSG